MDHKGLQLQRQLELEPDNIENARALSIWLRRSDFEVANTPFHRWLTELKSGTEGQQISVLDRLYELGPLADFALPALMNSLRDENAKIRQRSAEVIGEIGTVPENATAGLLLALRDLGAEISSESSETDEPQDEAIITGLVRIIHDQDSAVRQSVIQILTKMGRQSAPFLVKDFAHDDRRVRKILIEILVTMKEVAVPSLVLAITSKRGRAQRFAQKVFRRMDERVVPAIMDLLGSDKPRFRLGALKALHCLGNNARIALPELRGLVNDSNERVRLEVEKVFQNLGLKNPQAGSSPTME